MRTHVLDTALGVEAKVLVEAKADVVAVEAERVEVAVEKGLLEGGGNGALARGGEAGEPDGRAALAEELGALVEGNSAWGQRLGRGEGYSPAWKVMLVAIVRVMR